MHVERQGLHVHGFGLCINPEFTFLWASPDGIFCDIGTSGIIEIMCLTQPETWRLKIHSLSQTFFLHKNDDKISLKKSRSILFHLQGQLMTAEVTICDFLVYTWKEINIKRIHPDVDSMRELGSNLTETYFCYFHNWIE